MVSSAAKIDLFQFHENNRVKSGTPKAYARILARMRQIIPIHTYLHILYTYVPYDTVRGSFQGVLCPLVTCRKFLDEKPNLHIMALTRAF